MPSSMMTRTRTERSDTMGRKLTKLIDVKSIVTLALTAVFAFLSITGKIMPEYFMEIFKLIIIFYFGSQVGKREALEGKEGDTDGSGTDKSDTR